MTNTKDRVADATANVRPYLERALRDEELRQSVKNAYTSARSLYDQLLARNDASDVAVKLATDEEVHAQVRNMVEQLRRAAGRAQTAKVEEKAPRHRGRNGLLLAAGVALGLLLNPLTGPPLRGWLKRTLFGRGDGFTYHDGNGTPLH